MAVETALDVEVDARPGVPSKPGDAFVRSEMCATWQTHSYHSPRKEKTVGKPQNFSLAAQSPKAHDLP